MKKWQRRSLALLMAGLMTISAAAFGSTAFAADTQAERPQAVLVSAAKPTVAKPAKISVSNVKKGFKVSWKKVSGATGYQVWRSANNGKSYIKAKTVKGGSKTSFTNTASAVNKTGKKFKYKVRAYKVVKGKTYYGPYSAVKAIYKAPNSLEGTTWKAIKLVYGGKTFSGQSLKGFNQKITFNNGIARVYNNGKLDGASPYTYKNAKIRSDGITMTISKGTIFTLASGGVKITYKKA